MQFLFQFLPSHHRILQVNIIRSHTNSILFEIINTHTGTLVRKEVLTRLQNLLDPIVANWSLFAQQIGVPYTKITQIQTVNARIGPTWISTCLQQALEWWVENGRSPTYEAIIATLDPPGDEMTPVMNRRLAGRVREFMARERGEVWGHSMAALYNDTD